MMHDSIAHSRRRATTDVTVMQVAQYGQYLQLFRAIIVTYYPDIKNAYFPNLQKYPKARVLFYPYIKKFPI